MTNDIQQEYWANDKKFFTNFSGKVSDPIATASKNLGCGHLFTILNNMLIPIVALGSTCKLFVDAEN